MGHANENFGKVLYFYGKLLDIMSSRKQFSPIVLENLSLLHMQMPWTCTFEDIEDLIGVVISASFINFL